MAERLGPKHGPRKHLAVKSGYACHSLNVTAENITSVPQRVTCVPCRNSPQFVDAIARQLVTINRGRRPRRGTR